MTRLTPNDVKNVPGGMNELDTKLEKMIGTDLKGLACSAANVSADGVCFGNIAAAVVPMTSGKGVISGFSESVAAAARSIGMNAFITHSCDVTGIAEAFSLHADIIFMADDESFIALNTRSGTYSDNVGSTAKGFVTALSMAAGTLQGKRVLVVGAGRVGTAAAEILIGLGADVEVTDIIFGKAKRAEERYGIRARKDVSEAISDNEIIFNASPGKISGGLVREGAIISSPGVPYAFDEAGEKKAKIIIHDILSLGVAVMAASSAASSVKTDTRMILDVTA